MFCRGPTTCAANKVRFISSWQVCYLLLCLLARLLWDWSSCYRGLRIECAIEDVSIGGPRFAIAKKPPAHHFRCDEAT